MDSAAAARQRPADEERGGAEGSAPDGTGTITPGRGKAAMHAARRAPGAGAGGDA
jgi:hypothetical protein